jgi:hypothetical protein
LSFKTIQLKIFFTWKYIKIIFFKKIIFNISVSKWSENTKKKLIWSKNTKILNFEKNVFETQKQIEFYEIQLKNM